MAEPSESTLTAHIVCGKCGNDTFRLTAKIEKPSGRGDMFTCCTRCGSSEFKGLDPEEEYKLTGRRMVTRLPQ